MKDLGNRYAKFNCNIMRSKWYRNTSPESRLCWHYLILHAKAFGISGIFDPIDTEYFAETWRVSEESVTAMIEAATEGGALSCESSEWCIDNWGKHQGDPTAAERMARFRERQRTQPTVTDVTRNERNVTEVTHITTITTPITTTTEESTNVDSGQEKETKTKKRFVEPSKEEVSAYMKKIGIQDYDDQAEAFIDRNITTGWVVGKAPMKNWEAACRTWKRNGEKYGYGRKNNDPQMTLEQMQAIRNMQ
jgi:hypothetical protein